MLRIGSEARNYSAVPAFMVRQEQTQILGAVHLINHELREGAAELPLQFTLAASWRAEP